ncbi:MAG: glycosyltransferase family 4 protein [Pseudomonadota bacterium]|nr:glycosyltransferase family 4 protein [Pseudomonadota bacterium]
MTVRPPRPPRPSPSHPSPAPRIIFVNRYYDPDQSATSQMLTDLARGLAARGFDVHVVCSRQLYDDPGADLPAAELLRGVRVHRVTTTRFGRTRLPGRALDYASFYVNCALMLLKLVRRGDVLVAKTDPPLLSIVAAAIAKTKRAALINWLQDVFPEVASKLGANPLPAWLDRAVRGMRDASLRAAAMNVSIGGRMRAYLAGRGIPESQLCVIENWADGDAIQPKPAAMSALRARLNLLDRFVVCYSGNLGRAHEFATFLGAAEALKEDPNFIFLVIGGGAKMESLERAVAARALDNFRFLPYQPRDALADSLAAADVHLVSLLPGLEGLIVPSKLFGILAAGRASIFIGASDGEVGQVIERASCGRQVKVGDSPALVDTLRSLQADRAVLLSMGVRARQVFSGHYGVERALERWVALIGSAPADTCEL